MNPRVEGVDRPPQRVDRERLDPSVETIGAEVLHVIRHEMALRLSDIVVRRTGVGSAGPPPRAALETAARIAAEELGWDARRTADEIAAVRKIYEITES